MTTSAAGAASLSPILQPFSLLDVELKNRIVFQPHFTALPGTDGMPSRELHAYHAERAWGGVGLIIDGGMAVMAEGKMSDRFLSAWDERIIAGYGPMLAEVHSFGTKIFGQLTHGGHTSLENPPGVMWAPTQMPEPSSSFSTKWMDERDLKQVIEGFRVSANNLISAGFDGIEVKIAHDGLLRSFVSPMFNRREDSYGGTFEKRMRLPHQVFEALREIVSGKPLGVRLCLDEYTPFGYGLDYGLQIAAYLEKYELVDYFNCDAGSFSSFWMEIPPAAIAQGHFRPLNQRLKAQSSLPVVAFGRIKRIDLAEHMLRLGEADLIGMARQLIADAETVRKLSEGRLAEIRACIGCNDGCIHQVVQEKGIRCVQNPAAGQELLLSPRRMVRTERPQHLVVVGGGPAGMKFAEIAAQRGHRVSLFERHESLGGQARLAARQPHHEEFAEVTAYLEAILGRLPVDVWRGVEATASELLEMEADLIVVATGSQPNLPPRRPAAGLEDDKGALGRELGLSAFPPVEGLELPNVYSSDEVLEGCEIPGHRVLVVDGSGHWEAAGTAEYLADQGYSVELISARPFVGYELEATNQALFSQRAAQKGIRASGFSELLRIENGRALVVDTRSLEQRWIESLAGVVPIYSRRSRDDLYIELLRHSSSVERTPRIERLGDAAMPRLVQGVLAEAQTFAYSFDLEAGTR